MAGIAGSGKFGATQKAMAMGPMKGKKPMKGMKPMMAKEDMGPLAAFAGKKKGKGRRGY